MVVKIGGRRMYLWRAVDGEGVVLDVLAGCCYNLSDLCTLIEDVGALLAVFTLAATAVAEEGLDAVEELFLPLTDLDGMDLVRLGELGDGLGLLGGLQSDLGLEGGGMPLAVIVRASRRLSAVRNAVNLSKLSNGCWFPCPAA